MVLAGFTDEAAEDIQGQVRVLKELGWSSMEIRTVDSLSIHEVDEAKFDAVRRYLEEQEIGVCCLGSTIANWGHSLAGSFSETRETVTRTIKRMKLLKAPMVRIMSYKIELDADGRMKADQRETERFSRLREICSMFLDSGLTPVHENCHTYGGMSYGHTLRLLEEIPGLKLVYDTGNPALTPDFTKEYPYPMQDAWEFYTHVRPHIVHVHIKDAIFDPAQRKEVYLYPGEGAGYVQRTVADLLQTGYKGVFSIEPHMAVVFHDASVKSDADLRYQNFLTYGRKFETLVSQIGARHESVGFVPGPNEV